MNRNIFLKKTLVFIITVSFIFSINPFTNAVSQNIEDISSQLYISSLNEKIKNTNLENNISVTCYVFQRGCIKKCIVTMSSDETNHLYKIFLQLKQLISNHPFDDETQILKQQFIDQLSIHGLIPKEIAPTKYSSLLNPSWIKNNRNNNISFFQNPYRPANGTSAIAFLCSMASEGSGWIVPPIMFPRPRLINGWVTFAGATTVAELYTLRGFVAEGFQIGLSLGSIGIGLSFAIPGAPPVFGFIGYALFTTVYAKSVTWYPQNAPKVSQEQPSDGAQNIPITLSELSFRIEDKDGDLMDYEVTTIPDIGSGSGQNKPDGTYKIPISGLKRLTQYTWRVLVSDGRVILENIFSFTTTADEPIVSNPNPTNNSVNTPVNLSYLSFTLKDYQEDLMDYTVETSPNIGSSSGIGVGDGTYSVSVGGLEYSTKYYWFVNVTDGVHWTYKVFSFQTEMIMHFDPFEEGWHYRKQIVIDHEKVAGNLVNFPVLATTIDIDLHNNAQDDGDDILFMDGTGVANRLFHENEFFDSSSGKLIVWVKIPNLSSSQDTIFYMYYGNPNCNSQQLHENVWDENYCSVWHLSDLMDSTKNGNDGTNHETNSISGKIGEARDFEKNNSAYIDWGDMPEPANGVISTGTFEMWVKPDEHDGKPIIKFNSGSYEPDRSSYILWLGPEGKISYWAYSGSWFPDKRIIHTNTNDTLITTGNWQHVAAVIDLSNQNMDFYYNGQEEESTKIIEGSPPLHFYDIDLSEQSGRISYEGGMNFYNGVIDELRISKVCRSSSWISTEFNNQNDPINFLSFGPEESTP